MIRIVIADDQRLMRDGLQTMINLTGDMEVVALAENGLEAVRLAKERRPDLVLMDIQMPVMDGIAATKQLRTECPDVKILILSTYAEDDYIIEALVNGACGFLLKDLPGEKMMSSIRDAVGGTLLMPNAIASRLAAKLNVLASADASAGSYRRPDGLGHGVDLSAVDFTEKEREIIALMTEGRSNREIAGALFVSEGTMRNYISVIYNKIGVNDRLKAVALLSGWLERGP